MAYQLKTQPGYEFLEVASALQKEIRRGNEEAALYWAFELIPIFENYLWKRLKVIVNEDVGIASPMAIVVVQTLSNQYWEMRGKNDSSCTMCVANAILIMCRAKKTRIADHLTIVMEQTKAEHLADRTKRREIPDYALDMHTNRGRSMTRGLKHFREEGALLNNRDEAIDDPYEDNAYRRLSVNPKKWPAVWNPLSDKAKKDENTLFKMADDKKDGSD